MSKLSGERMLKSSASVWRAVSNEIHVKIGRSAEVTNQATEAFVLLERRTRVLKHPLASSSRIGPFSARSFANDPAIAWPRNPRTSHQQNALAS